MWSSQLSYFAMAYAWQFLIPRGERELKCNTQGSVEGTLGNCALRWCPSPQTIAKVQWFLQKKFRSVGYWLSEIKSVISQWMEFYVTCIVEELYWNQLLSFRCLRPFPKCWGALGRSTHWDPKCWGWSYKQNIGLFSVGFHREIVSDDNCDDKAGK